MELTWGYILTVQNPHMMLVTMWISQVPLITLQNKITPVASTTHSILEPRNHAGKNPINPLLYSVYSSNPFLVALREESLSYSFASRDRNSMVLISLSGISAVFFLIYKRNGNSSR